MVANSHHWFLRPIPRVQHKKQEDYLSLLEINISENEPLELQSSILIVANDK